MTFNPADWPRVKAVFDSALEHDADTRREHVAAACGDDIALRAQVEVLLASHGRAVSFLETQAGGLVDADRAPADDLVGRNVGGYRVVSHIGAGGMGEVYLADDLKLNRPVALKLLPRHLAADADRLRRFRAEAQAVSSLNHPHILVIHDFGDLDGRPFMVSELVEGETVRQRLACGALPLREAVEIGVQVASALAAAHARQIVHRDVKPENVMIRPDGYVKVLDFGLAKLMSNRETEGPADPTLLTQPGIVMGTLRYMSPEQARGLGLDARTDVWSLGVMLYEMITGRAPFGGATGSDVAAAILLQDPPPLAAAATAIPASLDRIVTKTLRKARDERHETATELHAELRTVRLELDVESHRNQTSSDSLPRRTTVRTAKPRRQPIRALAVLPLQNLSGNPLDDYFSDGMTEALIASLAQCSALRVSSRSSAMRYKNSGKPLPEIARDLKVDAIVEGSVLVLENHVRITAQLIEAASDTHLWARSYERELRDVLTLQNEVARSVVDEIQLKITPRERARLRRAHQVDPEAYTLYLRGRFHWHKRDHVNIRRAIDYFTQALARDPAYAAAHGGIADSYMMLGFSLGLLPPREWAAITRSSAERALQLDERLGEAHNSLAFAKLQEWDWTGAGRGLRRAIELNANDPVAHNWYANYLAALGRFDEALQAARRAIDLDPLTLTWNMGLGHMYYLARRYDDAIEQEMKTLEMDASFYMTHWVLGLAYEQLGRLDESVASLEKAVSLSGGTTMLGLLGRAYALAGRTAEAAAVLTELSAREASVFVPRDALALIHAGLDDNDRAMELLEEVCDAPSFNVMFLKVSPIFDRLRSHPRFRELLRRAHLEVSP